MSYEEKAQYLFTKYQQAIFLNVIFAILFMYLDLGVKTCLIMAVVFVGLGILTYFMNQALGFLTVSVAIGSMISAVYEHLEIGLTFFEGNGKLAIAPVIILLLVTQLLYVLMKTIMIEHSRKRMGIILALAFSIGITVLSYILSNSYELYFSGIFYITLLLMIIFLSSIICTLYMEGSWPIKRLLMVSYVIIFVLVFGIVLTLVLEEESILELFIPDDLPERKKRGAR